MKLIVTVMFLLTVLVIGGCNKKCGEYKLSTEEDKTFYSIGAMFGSRLGSLKLTDKELLAIAQGLRDTASGKKSQVDMPKYQKKVRDMFKKRMESISGEAKKEGVDYLENFLKNEGGKKTPSGLAYKIIKEGTGKKPLETERVEVHYHGTLIDGTVFDSSVDRKKSVQFPLNRVIKGWKEGLQLVKEGGKIKLVIPSDLGYGAAGAPPKIPGGSTLVFDVELIKIVKVEDKKSKINIKKSKKEIKKTKKSKK